MQDSLEKEQFGGQVTDVSVKAVTHAGWQTYYACLSPEKREYLRLRGCDEKGMGVSKQTVLYSGKDEGGVFVHELIVLLKDDRDMWGWSKASIDAQTGVNGDEVRYHWDAHGWDTEALEQAYLGWYLSHKEPLWKKRSYRVPQLLLQDNVENKGKDRGRLLARVINEARYWIDAPAESMGPHEMEGIASQIAAAYGASIEVISGADLAEGFPLVQAVGRASPRSPRVLDISWQGGDKMDICLVGKGVCFDTGGVNLKPAGGMRLMRKDMGGAAIVLGLAKAVMALSLPIKLRVLVPLADNAVSGGAFRPGDVFKARNGLRVEVGNTDAEGRLLLADCLSFASEGERADLLVDVATLTGAARVAVGTDIAALMTRNDVWSSKLVAASKEVGDPMWSLPLHDVYKKMLSSEIADMVSCGESGYAGAITAGLFLERFVRKEWRDRWCHVDTMAWNPYARPGRPEGGEPQGVRSILRAIEQTIGF